MLEEFSVTWAKLTSFYDDPSFDAKLERALPIEEVLFVSHESNFALLRTKGHNLAEHPPLTVERARDSVEYFLGRYAFTVGYPARDPRVPTPFLDALLGHREPVKRVMPDRVVSIEASSSDSAVRQITSDLSTTAGTAGGHWSISKLVVCSASIMEVSGARRKGSFPSLTSLRMY
jgi:hypothetical protein